MDIELYISCARQVWTPGFGDRDAYGIVMTGVYVTAAVLATLVAVRGPFRTNARRAERGLWVTGAVVLGFLAINKQLDLQSMAVAGARCVARHQGWYETRRVVQSEVILALIIATVLLVPALLWLLRRAIPGNRIFVLGLAGLVAFVLVRAISFHHLDVAFGTEYLSLRLHRVIEVVLLGAIILTEVRRISVTPG